MTTTTSFLPEDYLDQKAERRTNLISLSLFGVVMVSVFAAFLVTNRQWSQVKTARGAVNEQYAQAAAQIETLNELEEQKNQMLSKARLAAALVERVPRSILLSELINRMPNRLGLVELELKEQELFIKRMDESRLVQNVRDEIEIVRKKLAEQENKRYGKSRTGLNTTHQLLQQELTKLQGITSLQWTVICRMIRMISLQWWMNWKITTGI